MERSNDMKSKILLLLKIALASMVLVGCYPNDDEMFEKYSNTFMDPNDYDPLHPDQNSPWHNPYVDLGLSSGILWAEYNIGAESASELGESFAYSPYIVLQNWKDPWIQPSKSQYQELIDECVWVETTLNGVKGFKAIGPNENTIFFPSPKDQYYWTSTATVGSAICLEFGSVPYGSVPYVDLGYESKEERHYVRACRKSNGVLNLSNDNIAISSAKQDISIEVISTNEKIDAYTNEQWVSVSVSGKTIKVSCDENSSESQRTAKVYIVADKLKRIFTILQDAKSNVLELSQTSFEFSHKGGTKTISVTTNGDYRTEISDDSWLKTQIINKNLQITVEPNSTLSSKQMTVVVTTGSISKNIYVKQSRAYNIPEAIINSVTAPMDQIVIKGSVDVYDAAIKEYGVVGCYSSSPSKLDDLSLDNYMSISRLTSKNKKATINITINGNGYWYGNKDYYFYRAYVITTDGHTYYSSVSEGVKPTSR